MLFLVHCMGGVHTNDAVEPKTPAIQSPMAKRAPLDTVYQHSARGPLDDSSNTSPRCVRTEQRHIRMQQQEMPIRTILRSEVFSNLDMSTLRDFQAGVLRRCDQTTDLLDLLHRSNNNASSEYRDYARLEPLLDDLEATLEILDHTRKFYANLLEDIFHYNECVVDDSSTSELDQQFADQTALTVWLQQAMRAKWQHRTRARKAERRAMNRAYSTRSFAAKDQTSRALLTAQLQRERRKLNKRVFDSCVSEQLSEIAQSLKRPETRLLQELEDLTIVFEAQRALFQKGCFSLPELVEALDAHQDATSFEHHYSTLETELDIFSTLLDFSAHEARAVWTRVRRLAALDADDPGQRQATMRRRLRDPRAPEFVARSCEDLQTTRDVVSALLEHVEKLNTGISAVAKQGLDHCVEATDSVLALEVDWMGSSACD
ncbi:hypothetical protein LTR16_000132 [Cryomyces antarcticus]|uniref:Uncharacterized protein n=1 Tax=Cryomyces antarcticus TaxID=329879 RepID=A0ABR0M9A5_9PEZI|nr:hypothetical protein LTR39_001134 [Cryomyces antarcticus]KAK5297024.1 hypothetical protein LTR16_000132 [Cryomyces antarcticus]